MNKQRNNRGYLETAMKRVVPKFRKSLEQAMKKRLAQNELRDNTVWYKGYLVTEDERDQLQNRD